MTNSCSLRPLGFLRHLAISCAALTLVACLPGQQDPDDPGADAGGGSMADGSLADAGGGGEDAGGGCADCACAEIDDEATCAGRDDCLVRRDVFDAFADCAEVADAMCRRLDEGQCGSRDDCEWAGGGCREPQLACPDHEAVEPCVAAGCHWWADQCNADRAPRRCDQPDPASCEAANCEWSNNGCREPLPTCGDLARPACDARAECRWRGNVCERDPASMECGELAELPCHMRADCGWTGAGCIELDRGPCAGLGEPMCAARPDCEGVYDEESYEGCRRVEVQCEGVPPAACDATPGCHVEVIPCCPPDVDCDCADEQVCVPDGPPACEALEPAACGRDPRCELHEVEVCDADGGAGGGGGMAPPPDEDGDGVPDRPEEDRAAPPADPPGCWVEQVCEPREAQPGECDGLAPDACLQQPGCELLAPPCACDPAPCDCAPGEDCLCVAPEPCECEPVCVDARPDPDRCEGLEPRQCGANAGCEWVEAGNCACFVGPDGEEMCDCDAVEGFCQERDANACWDLDEAACIDDPDCEWFEGGGGAPAPEPCACPDGDDNCACVEPAPPPPLGFCDDAGDEGGGRDDGEVPPEPGDPGEPDFFP